jgi:hypothetical protein
MCAWRCLFSAISEQHLIERRMQIVQVERRKQLLNRRVEAGQCALPTGEVGRSRRGNKRRKRILTEMG